MILTLMLSLGGLVGAAGGLWIAALFVPTIAGLVKSTLDFLRSPIGMLAGVGALCAFLFLSGWIGGDVHGSTTTRAAWRAADVAKAKAEASRELALEIAVKRDADVALATDDTFSKSLDQQVQKNEAENPDHAACRRATGADLGRLLSIR